MSEATALEKSPAPAAGFGEMIQQAPQPQGLTPTVVPLDRETLAFYGSMITAAGLVPVENNVNPEMSKNRVLAKIVAGTSYGFDPILAQQCFDVLYNRMTPNAHGMEILFRDSGEYDTRIKVLNDLECTVTVLQRQNGTFDEIRGQYVGGEWHAIGDVTFTVEMAKQAGWTTNKLWTGTPADMCYSKVMKRVVKRYNPTCLRPRMLLGNHFAKAHQVAAVPQAAPEPAQIAETVPVNEPTPEIVTAANEPYVDPVHEQGEGPEAQIVEYTGTEQDHVAPEVIAAEPEDTDAAAEASAEEAETVEAEPIDEDESKLADLRIAVKEALVEKVGSLKGDQKVFLRGREIDNEDAITLGAMLADLNAM